MLASEASRRVSRQRRTSGGPRREHRPRSPRHGVADSASGTRAGSGESPRDGGDQAGESRPVRIRRSEFAEDSDSASKPPEERPDRPTRRRAATAPGDDDLDSQLQLTLNLSEPEPRGYQASASPPRERAGTIHWLWVAMAMGTVTCPILLGFQLVFTNPAHGLNVLAVVVTMSFGALFATWTFEYWLRRGTAATVRNLPIWTLTRHAILSSMGVAAMAVSALNRTASFGLLILVILTLIVADIVLRRLRIR